MANDVGLQVADGISRRWLLPPNRMAAGQASDSRTAELRHTTSSNTSWRSRWPTASLRGRGTANSFFLTVNTGLAALLGSQDLRWYVAASGIVFAITWWALLKSYRDLNAAKFEVILAMEERLPARLYGDEWSRLRREPVRVALHRASIGSWLAQYRELGRIERIVPWIFAVIYVAEILRQVIE